MSEDKKADLGRLILSEHKADRKDLQDELAHKPYSQPIQRLAALTGLANNHSLMRYSWLENIHPEEAINSDDILSISTVTLKDKKSPSVEKPHPVKKATEKPKTKKQKLSKLDPTKVTDFSAWLSKSTTAVGLTTSQLLATNIPEPSEEQLADETTVSNSKKKKAKKKKAKKAKDKKVKSKNKGSKKDKNSEGSVKTEENKDQKNKKLKKKKKSSKSKALKKKIADSIARKEEIASETLAKLYEEQGYYKKAIEVYEQLSLKYPEKSSFFAHFIADIKLKLK